MIYGVKTLAKLLRNKGYPIGKSRVRRLMSEMFLHIKPKSKYKKRTSINTKNILNRNFKQSNLSTVWCGDITEIPCINGKLYLSIFKDLCSRKIVGYNLSDNMKTAMVIDSLEMAIKSQNPDKGLMIHSDKGSQYGSRLFTNKLHSEGFVQSMSGKGACYDNAVVEGFFAKLKTELNYEFKKQRKSEVRLMIYEYINVFYNRKRVQQGLGYLSPNCFEKEKRKKCAII